MNYKKILDGLNHYNNYELVCDSYKRRLRQEKHYRKWRRITEKLRLKLMTPSEKRILQTMFEVSCASHKYYNG
jgi:hypothetical protein